MAQNSDSRTITTVVQTADESALRVVALVADASRALWVEDASLALPRITELLVAEGLAAHAVIEIEDEGGVPLRAEAPVNGTSSPVGGVLSVPIVVNQQTAGTISAELAAADHPEPGHVTTILKGLAQFIGPAVAAQRGRHIERARLADENTRLRGRLHGRHDFSSIIGNSEAMREVCEVVAKAAPTGTSVLLQGEAGTGKEFLARALHHSSPWARRAFVEYSCSRVSGDNLEADLLEQLRGRDAAKKRPPLADGGTLFLDDVDELTPHAQAQLMRVLQLRELNTGTSTSPHAQVRLIAGSESLLDGAVTDGRFRADVFHRLSGFSVAVPPLRGRKADIPLLADFFLEKFACEHGKPAVRISARALDMLTRYQWPGNVRELANVIERAVLLCDEQVVHGHHLSPAIHTAAAPGIAATFSLEESLDAFEKDLLLDALRAAKGVRSRAARLLQTTDRIFNYKVRKHAIDCRRFKA